jgi:hypothetical protein
MTRIRQHFHSMMLRDTGNDYLLHTELNVTINIQIISTDARRHYK